MYVWGVRKKWMEQYILMYLLKKKKQFCNEIPEYVNVIFKFYLLLLLK